MSTRLRIDRLVVAGPPRVARMPGLRAEIELALARRLAGAAHFGRGAECIAASVTISPGIAPRKLAARIADAVASALAAEDQRR